MLLGAVVLTFVEGWTAGVDFFLGKLPALNGKRIDSVKTLWNKAKDKLHNTLWPTLIENWKVWPAAQILNFSVVPLKYQILFVNCVAIWWNFVLSMMQHK